MDDFAALDTDRWLIQLYTFDANGCNMRAENVKVVDSTLRITVTKATDTTDRKWDGGDMGDEQYRTYGLFRTRMKPSTLKGSVSAFYIMNKWVPADWEHKEIDIEFVGKNPTKIQLTTHDFQDGGTVWKSDSKTVELGFDYGEAFHEYAILWRPDTVLWFADGKLLHKTGKYVPHEPLETRMNFYLGNPLESGVVQWLGPIDTAGVPDSTEYDWVRFDPLDSLPEPYRAFAPLGATRRGHARDHAVHAIGHDALGRREAGTAPAGTFGGVVKIR
jgi:beta-glucanase (GH16 family)